LSIGHLFRAKDFDVPPAGLIGVVGDPRRDRRAA